MESTVTKEVQPMNYKSSKWKSRFPYIIAYTILGITTLPIIFMYLWLLINSFTTSMKFGFVPTNFTLENWRFLWENVSHGSSTYPSIWLATWNSLKFAGILTILEVFIGVMAGYALSRLRFPGRKLILKTTLILHAFPSVTLLIAVFYILNYLGLIDTLWGVILVKTALQIPMTAWIIKGFFDDVPWDIEWAGMIDGCNRFKVWYSIVIPSVRPGIAAVSIFSFMAGWSEFLLLYTFILSEENVTLATYLQKIMSDTNMIPYGLLTAISVFYMIPIIIFFLFTQKSLMKVNMGGGKGV